MCRLKYIMMKGGNFYKIFIIRMNFINVFEFLINSHNLAACLGVADYQVDLLNYYYHHWSEDYIQMDNFDDYYWTVSEVYTP